MWRHAWTVLLMVIYSGGMPIAGQEKAITGVREVTGAERVSGQAAEEKRAGTSAGLVNINTASVAQLEALPGIGHAMAARIVEYREKNGAYKRLEDLMGVRGIGEKNFLKLKPLISVGVEKTQKDR